MSHILVSVLIFIISTSPIIVMAQNGTSNGSDPFITIWQTDNEGKSADNQITIPGEGTDYLIEWREIGNPDNIGSVTGSDEHTVTFPSAGLYEISISGNFTGINFGKYASGDGDAKKILDVVQWGDISWTSLRGAFIRASNLDVTAMDIPDLSKVTDLSFLFFEASSFNGDLSSWDVSNVAVMTGMFVRVTTFNGDLSSWDVS